VLRKNVSATSALTALHRSSLADKIMPLRSLLQPRTRRYVNGEATLKSPLGPNQCPTSARSWKNACGLRCFRTTSARFVNVLADQSTHLRVPRV